MRIAFLGDASLGHVQRWVSFFNERGHEVLLLSYEDTDACAFSTIRLQGHSGFKTLNVLLDLPGIRRHLAAFKPDVVNGLYAGAYGLTAVLSSYPSVVSALGSDLLVDYANSRVHRTLTGYSLRNANLVTTDAQLLSDIAIAAGARSEVVLTAYFGIDDTLFHPPEPPRAGVEPILISTRNLYRLYRVDVLIEALALVRRKYPAQAVICGDGPERAALEAQAASLDVAEACTFMGRQTPEEIADLLRSSGIYVSTSSSDSTSVSLLEAMGTGLPPVVSDIPANREWLLEGENGLYFPVGDAATLAACVERLLTDIELAAAQRERNLEIIRARGLWSRNMEQVEAAFRAL
ncbi:MAG: glycosyltransferase family 4 protein [bacterium]|nr:glycosyltransferase family 4 protein [bacterium]